MPVTPDDVANGACPYCGDPIPPDPPAEFSDIDPSYSTRII
jgi:rRNA maturation protein Nop10